MKTLQSCLLLLALLVTAQLKASTENERAQAAVQSFLNKYFNSDKIGISDFKYSGSGNEKTSSAMLSLFGIEAIKFNAKMISEEKFKSFEFEFPSASNINFSKLSRLAGGSIKQLLPRGFPMDAGISISKIGIDFKDSIIGKLSLDMGTAENWNILSNSVGGLKRILFNLEIESPTVSADRVVSGTITGQLNLGKANIDVSCLISSNDSLNYFSGKLNQLGLGDLLNNTVGQATDNNVLASVPEFLTNLSLDELEFKLFPKTKLFMAIAKSSIGQFQGNIQRMGAGNSANVMLAFTPPASNFNFASVHSSLAPLDNVSLGNTVLLYSSKSDDIDLQIGRFEGDKNTISAVKGFNIIAQINCSESLEQVLKVKSLQLSGFLASDFSKVGLSAALELNLSLGNDVKFKKVAVGFEFGKTEISIGLKGVIEATIDGDVLEFVGELKGNVLDVDLDGSLYMQALQKANNAKKETIMVNGQPLQPEWTNPFGIPSVGILSIGASIGISPKSPIGLSSLGFLGEMRIGTVSDFNRHIRGRFATKANIARPTKSLLDIQVSNMNVLSVIRAFSDVALEGTLEKCLNVGIDSGKMLIVPENQEFLGRQYEQGFLAEGKIKLLGIGSSFSFGYANGLIKASGQMDALSYTSGSLTLFAIKGKNSEKPSFMLDLNPSNPAMKFDASLTLMGITAAAALDINKTGIKASVEGNVLGGALMAKVNLTASSLAGTEGMNVSVEFVNNLQSQVADALLNFIQTEHQANADKIKRAQDQMALARSKSSNSVDLFFINFSSDVLSAASELERGSAVIGKAIVNGVLKDALMVRKLYFSAGLSSVKATMEVYIDCRIGGVDRILKANIDLSLTDINAIVKSIVNQIKTEIENVFKTITNEISQGFDNFINESQAFLKQLGEQIQQGLIVAGTAIMNAANDLIAEFDRAFYGTPYPAPAYGNSLARINPGMNKYTITLSSIYCNKSDDQCKLSGNILKPCIYDLDLYGFVMLNPVGSISTNVNSNNYFFSSQGGSKTSVFLQSGQTHWVNQSKDLYVTDANLVSSYITLYTRLLESDAELVGPEDDALFNTTNVNLAEIASGGSKNVSFLIDNSGQQVTLTFTITRSVKITDDRMLQAAASGNVEEVKRNINGGGNPFASGIISAAIRSRNTQMIDYLLKEGNVLVPAHLPEALQAGNYQRDVLNYLSFRIHPDGSHLDIAIANGNNEALNILLDNGAQANSNHTLNAINAGQIELAKTLLRRGVVANNATVQAALDKNNLELLKMICNLPSEVSLAQINASIDKQNISYVTELTRVIKPDFTSLKAAALVNNTELFNLCKNRGAFLTNNEPLDIAIDKNNLEILRQGIGIGGNSSQALVKAVSVSNKPAILICLENKANPNPAFSYAVAKKDEAFFNELILQYKGIPNTGAIEALNGLQMNMLKTAITFEAEPSLLVARAAELDSFPYLKTVVEAGGDPNPAMFMVVSKNRPRSLKLLLDNNASTGNPELIKKAITLKSLPMTKLLVENGADQKLGLSLASDISINDSNIVEYLCSQGAKVGNEIATTAGDEKQYKITKILLNYGADPNKGMPKAVENNLTRMVKLLLDFDANPKGFMGIPACKGNMKMVKDLIAAGANVNEGIKEAVRCHQNQIADTLFKMGAKVTGDMIKAPIEGGNLKMVESLVQNGADPQTGITISVDNNKAEILSFLIKNGAKADDQKLLITSVKNNFSSLIPILAKAGASLRYEDPATGNTFLHQAATNYNTLTNLVMAGDTFDINTKNNLGEIPLHIAVKTKSNISTVVYLVEHGSNINAVNNKGKSVRKSAKGHKIKKYLKKRGALKKVKQKK